MIISESPITTAVIALVSYPSLFDIVVRLFDLFSPLPTLCDRYSTPVALTPPLYFYFAPFSGSSPFSCRSVAALKILEEVRSLDFEVGEILYNSVMEACAAVGQTKLSLSLLEVGVVGFGWVRFGWVRFGAGRGGATIHFAPRR